MLQVQLKGYDYVLSTGACGFDIRKIMDDERPDIVQLHWIGGSAFRLTSLEGIRIPVVWRLSDQWAFCGVQHLEPDPSTYSRPAPRRANWFSRRKNISEHVRHSKWVTYNTIDNLVLVCPSHWLASETRRSALLGNRPVELIPTSCDTELFSPKDRNACRAALGLSADKHIVLVGATSMGTHWKGLDLFVAAMEQLSAGNPDGRALEVLTFGQDPFDVPQLKGSVDVSHLGPIRDRRLMSILYCAADVFAAPSRMENLSNAVLESLACGTPVVAFDIGGMPDMIDHKMNGYLAAPFSTADFAGGIRWALDQREREGVRVTCRQKVLNGFSVEQEIGRYIALYERLASRARC
jgi:glycosyltransferase involved in cell wall biosynthesis